MEKMKSYITTCLVLLLLFLTTGMLSAQQDEDASSDKIVLRDRIDGETTPQSEITSSIGSVSLKAVSKYPDLNLSNALQGQAAGLVIRANAGSLGRGSSINIRGLHAFGTNDAIIVVDGIERPMDDLMAEEIESIEILKDAAAKAIYGATAANGVVLIKTRRGELNKKILRASIEYGISPTAFKADYLDSYNYATLYNEARANDGLSPFYLPYQIQGYQSSNGANNLLYPNADYNKTFLHDNMDYTKASLEFNGGTSDIRYALNAGYVGGNGLEKGPERSRLDRINLRANLDIAITDYLNVQADVAGRMWLYNTGTVTGAAVFEAISQHRPNEYPFIIDPNAIGEVPNDKGVPTFGGSLRYPANLYADMMYGGYVNERYTTSQSNLGVNFDFDKYVEGLTINGYVTMDNYNYLNQQLVNTYSTYAISTYENAVGTIQNKVTKLRIENLPKSNSIDDYMLRRTFGWRANIGYKRTLDEHFFSAVAATRYMKEENKGLVHDRINSVYSLRLNYDFDKRYFAEAILSYMGDNKFADDNKFFLSPVFSVGWLLSNEDFLSGVNAINYLKLKAGYGILGYSGSTGFELHDSKWRENGTIGLGENNSSQKYLLAMVRIGNPRLEWETSEEINVGIEWAALDNRLSGEMNYFNEHHRDIIATNGKIYSDVLGNYTIAENVGETRNQGIDLSVNWNEKCGDFEYNVGLNFLYSKDKVLQSGALDNIEKARREVGNSSGAMYGLQALGLYGKDVNLSGAPIQIYGPYQAGDIAYFDQTGDGIVDDRDMVVLGRNFPTTVWGFNAELKYKNWGLYILATAETGADIWLSDSYYKNYGDGKYSEIAAKRYHPQHNPEGTYPRLTTLAGNNNYEPNSDFWLEKADFLRLKNVEVSYTLPARSFTSNTVDNFKFFVRGTNLGVASKVKDVDPEMPDAGITAYPAYSTYSLGLSITF